MKKQEKIWDKEYKKSLKWNKETKTLPDILKNKKTLELGLGNGKTLKAILKQKPKSVIAIDFSQEAINISKKQFNNENLKIIKASVINLPFKDKEFDIIICYYILNNLLEKERKKAIKEIKRVLKDKGKILFEDFGYGDFRQKGKRIEKNTIEKKNEIICHFFTKKELNLLFKEFSKIDLKQRISHPLKNKIIKRSIISGIIK